VAGNNEKLVHEHSMMNKIVFVLGCTGKLDVEIVCEKYISFTLLSNFFKLTTVVLLGLFISVKNLLLSHFYETGKAPALALKVLSSNTSLTCYFWYFIVYAPHTVVSGLRRVMFSVYTTQLFMNRQLLFLFLGLFSEFFFKKQKARLPQR